MTRDDDIIRWALEAGVAALIATRKDLQRFATLVAEAERESCAQVCEKMDNHDGTRNEAILYAGAVMDCAAAIRARGEP